MSRKVGKRKTREKRIIEPESYLVASEGTKTEVLYFQQIAEELSNKYQGYEDRLAVPSLNIEGMGTSNFRLIEDVDKFLRTCPRLFENIWLVFDKDDIPENYFDNAIKSAKSLGWHTAWTNDSFELWFLLHFEYLQSGITREQYLIKLNDYCKRENLAGYDKNNPQVGLILRKRRSAAIKNAQRLEDSYDKNMPSSKKNPCTTVHHLVKELIELENKVEKLKLAEKNWNF